MKVNLDSQVAVVTGAAQGIGLAIANLLYQNGARVVFTDRQEEKVLQAASNRPGTMAMVMDVTQAGQIENARDEILRRFGRIDILVNNAGVNTMAHRVTMEQFPIEEWDRLIEVDLKGVFLTSKTMAVPMLAAHQGRIINIASIAGLVPLRLQSPFVAAKAGVVNLTKSMALEFGPRGVLVNGVAPGSTLTQGTEALFYGADGKFKEKVQEMLNHVPLGRPGKVEEIAHGVLFLAAPESSYVNGHILVIDGGWTAGYHRDF